MRPRSPHGDVTLTPRIPPIPTPVPTDFPTVVGGSVGWGGPWGGRLLDVDELGRDVNGAMSPVVQDIAKAVRGLCDALGGAEGIERINQELDRAAEEKARWEAEHPGIRFGQGCHCLCQARGHAGVCDGLAVTVEPRIVLGEPHGVFMCQPCVDAVARKGKG